VRDPRHPPPPVRLRLLLPSLVTLAVLGGCGSACEDLGDRICRCEPPGGLRENCRRGVDELLDSQNESFCEARLDTCPDPSDDENVCDRLRTPQGKVDCGLAYPDPAAPAQ
jgi:hypothetical protein